VPEIKAVFFDIGNVLLAFDPKRVAAKIAWRLRHSPLKVARYLWSSNHVDAIERGEITPKQLFTVFQTQFEFEGSYGDFSRLWCDHFTLLRANAALLKRLAEKRKVYLLSNTNELHYDFIKANYAFPRHVHGAVLSYELGLRKPEAAIYRKAVELARVDAAQCLFVDDLAENVEAARRCGLQAIRHASGMDLRAAFKKIGVT
jgi:glucose-1-phosphatase